MNHSILKLFWTSLSLPILIEVARRDIEVDLDCSSVVQDEQMRSAGNVAVRIKCFSKNIDCFYLIFRKNNFYILLF